MAHLPIENLQPTPSRTPRDPGRGSRPVQRDGLANIARQVPQRALAELAECDCMRQALLMLLGVSPPPEHMVHRHQAQCKQVGVVFSGSLVSGPLAELDPLERNPFVNHGPDPPIGNRKAPSRFSEGGEHSRELSCFRGGAARPQNVVGSCLNLPPEEE